MEDIAPTIMISGYAAINNLGKAKNMLPEEEDIYIFRNQKNLRIVNKSKLALKMEKYLCSDQNDNCRMGTT